MSMVAFVFFNQTNLIMANLRTVIQQWNPSCDVVARAYKYNYEKVICSAILIDVSGCLLNIALSSNQTHV